MCQMGGRSSDRLILHRQQRPLTWCSHLVMGVAVAAPLKGAPPARTITVGVPAGAGAMLTTTVAPAAAILYAGSRAVSISPLQSSCTSVSLMSSRRSMRSLLWWAVACNYVKMEPLPRPIQLLPPVLAGASRLERASCTGW